MQLKERTELQGGKYRIVTALGQQGGFGITYLARQEALERNVVIKELFIKELYSRDRGSAQITTVENSSVVDYYKEKFLSEARSIAALEHPNVVRVIDVFEENGTAYYVMEYHPNGSLGSIIDKEGAMSEERALRYIRQVSSALRFVHENHIMHLDIKPDNILLNNRDEAVLIDFGVSKRYTDNRKGGVLNSTPVTNGYAPIEQYSVDGVTEFTPSTDIYSLGATFYTLLTGKCPPEPIKLVNNNFITEELERHKISRQTVDAIAKAMSFAKENRPLNVDEFLQLLGVPLVSAGSFDSRSTVIMSGNVANGGNQVSRPTVIMPANGGNSVSRPTVIMPANGGNQVSFPTELMDADDSCDYASDNKSKEYYTEGVKAYYKENYAEAVDFYTKAAELGHIKAQYFLGNCFEKGIGVQRNDKEAFKWYNKAAENRYIKAYYKLGNSYEYGLGVSANLSEALVWYRKAAERRGADAYFNVGYCYDNGIGVKKNPAEAIKWYRRASEQVNVVAMINSGRRNKMTDDEPNLVLDGYSLYKAGNQTEALEIWYKAAEQGSEIALYNIGACYYNNRNFNEAVKWWRRAAKLGDKRAPYYLADSYYYGEGPPVDINEAVMWYVKSAEQGYAAAEFRLGCCYVKGVGVAKNRVEAVKWWRKSAERGYAVAEFYLSTCYYGNIGVVANYTEAVKWCHKAAKRGLLVAQIFLAGIYENGMGVAKNLAEALVWYGKAAEQGDNTASEALQRLSLLVKRNNSVKTYSDKPQNNNTDIISTQNGNRVTKLDREVESPVNLKVLLSIIVVILLLLMMLL